MITPLSWLERVPSYKDQQEQLKEKDLATFGFLGYPLLKCADILAYQPDFVPVGQDQAAHVEITREIARRFNHLYGRNGNDDFIRRTERRYRELLQKALEALTDSDPYSAIFTPSKLIGFSPTSSKVWQSNSILPEPKVLLTPSPKLPGTDGRKMSKSYGNTILLSDPEPEVRAKLKTMVTDPARIRRTDPGNPDICPVFDLHKVFSSERDTGGSPRRLHLGGDRLHPVQGLARRRSRQGTRTHPGTTSALRSAPRRGAGDPGAGAVRANARAEQTMRQVRAAVGLG